MEAIENNFEDWLGYEYLLQSVQYRSCYRNVKYNITFFHDFEQYTSLKEQLPKVQEKYNRRIKRFYLSIQEPTLFVRYISDQELIEGVSKELNYIEENYEKILSVLKSFNENNDILFIANEGVTSSRFVIYNVSKDENDLVARSPISGNEVLFAKFNSFDVPKKQDNIKRYIKKERVKNCIYNRIKRKIMSGIKKVLFKEYLHEKEF